MGDDIESSDRDGFEISGFRQMSKRAEVELLNLREAGFVETECNGHFLKSVYVSKIVLDADVFLSDAHLADFILMHCQYTELGLSHRLVSYGARGSEAVARTELGSAVDYLVSCRWWSKELPYPQVEEFVNKYESTYGESPEWYAGAAYEAARALLQAINVAGSLDKAEIREALVQLEITDSLVPGQHLYFRENGQAGYPFIITQSRPDETVPIIYPADAAVTEATVTRPKVKFGCPLSLSGKLEEEGHLYKEGYELWKEHILTVHPLVLLPRTLCDLFQCL